MKQLLVREIKKLIPGILFSLLIIIIGLVFVPGLKEFIFFPENNTMVFYPIAGNGITEPGKVIDSLDEKKFTQNFVQKLERPIKWDSLKAMWWNNNIGGWQVNAKLLEDVIIKQNEISKLDNPIEEVWFRLGEREDTITKRKSMTIMIFGVDTINTSRNEYKYKIKTKKNIEIGKVINTDYSNIANDNYVIEYVQPCKHPCK
ncbi:MAG: hypothetical protein IPO04_07735 [Cytophagaceae bacterium]|nr:hypothetical protein [Cytophagaceae bacterium]